MARLCDQVELFVDGELPFEEADTFRSHYADCARCQSEVGDLMQLKLLGHRYVERAVGQANPTGTPPGSR